MFYKYIQINQRKNYFCILNKMEKRYRITWRIASPIVRLITKIKFNYSCEKSTLDTPLIIVSNHVTNWDPLLVGLSFTKNVPFFVASEHIFRWGFLSGLITWFFSPIPRRKGSSAIDTVMTCVRRIKKGSSICIFGEGEATWTGVTSKIVPSTGKLAKLSGATLVTYRIEGAYLSMPRWGQHTNRGKIHGRIVNTYSPEILKTMTGDEIENIINTDIYEDAWKKQKENPIVYKGKNKADGLNTALFVCPKCKGIDTLSTNQNDIRCTCGFSAELTDTGFFDAQSPFENIAQWDDWQFNEIKKPNFFNNSPICFSNDGIQLSEISVSTHNEKPLTNGTLVQYKDKIQIGEYTFNLSDISEMSIVRVHILLFTYNNKYYELRSDTDTCMRKYLAMWQNESIHN